MRALSKVWISVLVIVAASGCVRRSDPYGEVPRVTDQRLRNLHQLASRELACPSAALSAAPLTDRVWQVSGCNQVREYAIMGRGRGRYRGARWRLVIGIVERASSELACAPEMLSIAAPSALERSVSGCGHAATYAIVCDQVDCAWVMRGRVATSGASGSAGAARALGAQPSDSSTIVVVPQPTAPSDADTAIRTTIDAGRASILACNGGAGPVAVRATWGLDGSVAFELAPPLAGTPADGCARATFAPMRVASQSPGELIHVVQ